jgi:DNA-binding NtrC family response regulator
MHAIKTPGRGLRLSRRLVKNEPVRPLSLLIVDEAVGDRQSLAELLREGFGGETQIRECDSGLAALDILRRARIDVVLVDYRLPDMDGLELVSSIAEMADDMAVILMSDEASGRMAADAMKFGARDYLDRHGLTAPALQGAIVEALRTARLEWNTNRILRELRRNHEEMDAHVRDVSRDMTERIDDLEQSISELKRVGHDAPLRSLVSQFSQVEHELRRSIAVLSDLSHRGEAAHGQE